MSSRVSKHAVAAKAARAVMEMPKKNIMYVVHQRMLVTRFWMMGWRASISSGVAPLVNSSYQWWGMILPPTTLGVRTLPAEQE